MKKAAKEFKERIIDSWEYTLSGLLVLFFLVVYWDDVDSLLKALGAIGTILGLLMKKNTAKK